MAIPNLFGENDGKNVPDSGTQSHSGGLVAWCAAHVREAREVRDEYWEHRWEEYTRLWRGFWIDKDKNANSERSKIITPALSQAIEMTVAEMEEAVFSRAAWFDVQDDIEDEQKDDAVAMRDKLLEDFDRAGVVKVICEIFIIGAIYGTGIGKISVDEIAELTPDASGAIASIERTMVSLMPIRPDEFIIDPAARNVEEALFVAHEMLRPIHAIRDRQNNGDYLPGFIGQWNREQRTDTTGTGDTRNIKKSDHGAMIMEYFGKVPSKYIPGADEEAEGMTEAIVVIANEQTLLKVVENPFDHGDRPVIAYQHDTIPGDFWGRSVSEKGYNPQKALDAEHRAKIDALGLTTAPMIGADITRLPRNPDMRVRPGKTIYTRGNPNEIIAPFQLINPSISAQFQQTGDLERLVQMGTGAMDSATPNNISRRNETMGGMSMMMGGFIKRSKRTMRNVEHFLNQLVTKSLWYYQQFEPGRYPARDYKFVVRSTMGMMAKEVEHARLQGMLQFTPPDSPFHGIVLRTLYENIVSDHKAELMEQIRQASQPPTPEQQARQQEMEEAQRRLTLAQAAQAEAEARKTQAETDKLIAEARLALAKTEHTQIQADLEDDKVEIQAANAVTGAQRVREQRFQTQVAEQRNQIEAQKVRQGRLRP
jgi:hypothetical protein